MSTAMDIFLNATDSLPFPDVLDIDIKSETDTLVGGHNDFSGFNFNDLQPIEFEDIHDIKWFNSNSNQSNLDFSGEDGPTMVNPNAVMPIMGTNSPSPASFKESHLTFSPATIKISSLKKDPTTVKKDLIAKLESIGEKKDDIKDRIIKIEPVKTIIEPKKPNLLPQIKTVPKATPILAKQPVRVNTMKPLLAKTHNPTFLFKNANAVRHVGTQQIITPVITSVRAVSTSNPINRKPMLTTNTLVNYEDEELHTYPKPAYSYSCLIAMSLKNSRTGCLPVSEIYNFMCRHFPYFKTAPNGWKNSVRHNLSLNKCFEKIEKPAVNGAQRKGCLWAMNPAKISKMDEEVQKWSRKDPHAIKRAMVNPDSLESLERGELKFYSNDEGDNLDSCGSAESEGSESEPEQEQEQEVDFADASTQYQFIQIKDEEDIEVSEEIYSDQIEGDKQILRVEMALAQKELMKFAYTPAEYQRTINNKRRRMYIVQN